MLTVANQSGNVLRSIVNNVLDVVQIETGVVKLDRITFSIYDLMEEVLDIFSLEAQNNDSELILLIPSSLDLMFLGDKVRLRQVRGDTLPFFFSLSLSVLRVS